MATICEIPLTPDNLTFSIPLNGITYQMQILWRDGYWHLDLMDSSGNAIVSSIPLLSGENLLDAYSYLGLGLALYVICDKPGQELPTETDLGTYSHLIAVY